MSSTENPTDIPVNSSRGSASSPTESAKESLDARDLANAYKVFLGRAADLASVNSMAVRSLAELLRGILESDEFNTTILQPILLREALPHVRLGSIPPISLIDWAQTGLSLSAQTRIALGGVGTWTQLLELLLSDPVLTGIASHLTEAGIDSVLRQRLENEPWTKIKRSVIGAVDAASGFEIRGWAVDLCDKPNPVVLEFYADNLFLGSMLCSDPRPDVVDAVGGTGKCGFAFKIPAAHRVSFGAGRTLVAIDAISRKPIGTSARVYSDAARHWDTISETRQELAQLRQVLERIEARLPDMERLASIPIEAYDEYWERFYRPSQDVLDDQRKRSEQIGYRPLISVVIPAWNSDARLLSQAINSVCRQSYTRWELVVTDDASGGDATRLLKRRYLEEPRIRWIESTVREGIAANTNRGIVAAQGDYIAFLDHDDELAPDALFHVVISMQDRRYGLVYSDEDRIEENEFGRCAHHTPFFKPGFDPDLLLALNYICHLVVLRRDVVTSVGGLRIGFEGAQDHDLLLRSTAYLQPSEILHLPRVLYHWRVTPGSVSRTPATADTIQRNIVAAVEDHLQELKLNAVVEPHSDPFGSSRRFATRVRWCLPRVAPTVSIIVPTRDRIDLLRPCIASVLDSLEAYPGECEIVIADNDSIESETLDYFENLSVMPRARIIRYRGPFNWSAINNAAAREANGEVLIFLNNDTIVLARDWCVELVTNAIREDVGAVGARLLYVDGTIQHSGVVLGVEGVAGHEAVGETPEHGGYFGRSHVLRSAAAVTGACLATRHALFEKLDGGFDEMNLKVAFNDVDYCMRVRKAGYRIVYNPFAVLYHLESKSRGRDWSEVQQARHRQEAAFFRTRWSANEMTDPYYNLHFERFARPFERLKPPPLILGASD
jgi:GT2 family glycosyltransferase